MEADSSVGRSLTDDTVAARARLASRVISPAWLHPATGALVAQHVLVQGVPDLNWTLPSGVVLIVGCAVLWLTWRSSIGITVPAWAGSRSLLALAARSLQALFCVWWAAVSRDDTVVVVAAAVVAFIGSIPLGRVYDRALRRDLAAV
jgi:hypothetical protein